VEEDGPSLDITVEQTVDGEPTEGEEAAAIEAAANDDAKVDASAENVEFGVDMSKERDHVIVTWRCKKIVVPFRDEVQKGLKRLSLSFFQWIEVRLPQLLISILIEPQN